MVDIDAGKLLDLSARPMDNHLLDDVGRAQPEVEPLARLGQKTFTSTKRLDKWRVADGPSQRYFHPGADRISTGGYSVAFQPQRQKVIATGHFVVHQSQSRGIAVGNPHVQTAVVVPVDQGHGPAIVGIIKSADRRDVGEATLRGRCRPHIEKATVPLIAAE